MLIDCETCIVRGTGCADCVVTVLLGAPPGLRGADPARAPMGVDLDDVERQAVCALAGGGLVPPLRHRPAADGEWDAEADLLPYVVRHLGQEGRRSG